MDLQKIIEFAVESHKGQFRKHSGLPYIVHPMAVMSMLSKWEIDDPLVLKAALCHDILEDCPNVTEQQIADVAGEDTLSVVKELTFICTDESHKPKQKSLYLESFASKSLHALVVKIADRICNIHDFIAEDPPYAAKYFRKASSLFNISVQRKLEITDAFGLSSFPRMRYAITKVCEQCTE